MIRLTAALALTVLTTGALAQVGPSTTGRPCSADRALVSARGAVVLSTGQYTYGRFVRDARYCQVDQYPQPAFVPSDDTAQCFVGYRCADGPDDDL
ncbi:hypothetical protein [Microvirga lotononidis]|uniref:Secreted protein n=1 Tax=Microvirga lotononidis TaxID=864069 RepID=I4YYR5_9HYPH|nr:hypothetical protein [Microvirga lotononidis]EIM29107.1 hypothetical protein MicloDRAFT_00015780 [Microvirga lotononidis]WQO28952.1 hypothetical protein U0023_07740 [Microvirga lotononidis]